MIYRQALSFFARALVLLAFTAATQAAQTYVGVFFDVASINAGGTAAFDMQLRENDGTAFTNGAITVTYPAGLVNDGQYGDPLITENCTSRGAVITRTAGTNQLVVTNVSLAAFDFCDIYVRITGSTFGSYTITVPPGSFSSTTPATTNSATTTATLNVNGPVMVTNVADFGAGSLRDAINTVNANCGAATGVKFNIPGTGPFAIIPAVAGELPALTCNGSYIDGYSQPGSSVNTNPSGANNASIQVLVRGTSCGPCNGLTLSGSGIQVSGLAIHSFNGNGILSNATSGSNAILGNFIGTDESGMVQAGNLGAGIAVNNAFASIGDGSPAGRNLITANVNGGVVATTGSVSINGNQIGGLRNASPGVGNGVRGIWLNGANYSSNYVLKNLVVTNGGAGIAVAPSTTNKVVIEENESYQNSGLGIDIRDDGATANDEASPPYDTDGVQNYAVVTGVYHSGGSTIVSGYLKSAANGGATIYLYHNTYYNPQTEGEKQIDTFSLPLDATGYATFTRTVGGTWDNVTAQASVDTCSGDGCLRSSEYSPKVGVSDPLVVTNTNDSGAGSLRDAINFVNFACAGQAITFNIPGAGVQSIRPLAPLPPITCNGTVIDGYSQPGTSMNGLATGWNGQVLIELNGSLTAGDGITINAPGVMIRGLAINGFSGTGVMLIEPIFNTGPSIVGNIIGLSANGSAAVPNGYGIANSPGATGPGIGGPSPAERNIISGNLQAGIYLRSGDVPTMHNNYIGTDPSGAFAFGNGSYGIYMTNAVNAAIVDNVVSGNGGGTGIYLDGGSSNAFVQRNVVGLNASGTGAVGNQYGIRVYNSNGVVIGGPSGEGNAVAGNSQNGIETYGSVVTIQDNRVGILAGATQIGNGGSGIVVAAGGPQVIIGGNYGNVIAYNARHGVIALSNSVEILGNSIFQNGQGLGGLGINLQGDASFTVPANDSCDVDGGGNGLANFPLLSSAQVAGGFLSVGGTLNSTANTTFIIEVFSSPAGESAGNRSGKTSLGSFTVTTDGTCNATISNSVSAPLAGDEITATSTDPSSNTSSFSNMVIAAAGAPQVSFSLSTIDFGTLLTGTTSTTFTLGVINTGNATLNISSALVSAPFVVTGQTCAATLAAAASCTYDLKFAPTAAGVFNGTFTLSSDAPTASLPLVGLGMLPPSFAIATFASRTAGQVSTVTARISNPSANPVAYANIDVQLDYPAGFVHDGSVAVSTSCGAGVTTVGAASVTGIAGTGGSVAPGVNCGEVASQLFAPTTPGTYTFTIPAGGFTIGSPFPYANPSPITATVTVTVAPTPGVSFSPASLVFGPQTQFTTSASLPVTLTNTGNAALNISSIFTVGDFLQSNSCPASLAASASCVIDVSFKPDFPGTITGYLQVTSDAPGSPHQLALSGTGVALAPLASITPTSLAFAARTVSTTSPAQTITLANTGNAPLAISSIVASGDFAFATACATSIPAGGSCTIDVTFTPIVAGARSGTLTIIDNAAGSPHTISLGGTGLTGAAAVLAMSASVIDFAALATGTDSAPEIVTVTNAGTAPLVFSAITITGAEFRLVTPTGTTPPACPVTLAPGAACRIAIVFHPTGLNLRTGKLNIASNGGNAAVDLFGTAVIAEPPQLNVPASIDFGSQPVGRRSAGFPAALKNVSPFIASVTELTASGDFAVSDTCTTIAIGATCSPLVTFQPTAVGPREGALVVRTLRDTSPYSIRLLGNGIQNLEPALELSATQMGYGNAFLGQLVTHEVTLRNTGQAVLQVASILAGGDFFTDGACIGALAPNATCTVRVTFGPSSAGGHGTQLQIASNAPDSPHFVSLSGTGCFLPSPGRARFGAPLCAP